MGLHHSSANQKTFQKIREILGVEMPGSVTWEKDTSTSVRETSASDKHTCSKLWNKCIIFLVVPYNKINKFFCVKKDIFPESQAHVNRDQQLSSTLKLAPNIRTKCRSWWWVHRSTVRIAGLLAKIWTWDFLNTKQECQPSTMTFNKIS